jgi:hypothetical protein
MRPALVLTTTLIALALAGCQTTRGTVTTGKRVSPEVERQARCAGWKDITYSGKSDTKLTVDQIRRHNSTGIRKRCWK